MNDHFHEELERLLKVGVNASDAATIAHARFPHRPYSRKEICEYFGIGPSTLARLQAKRRIPFLRLGGRTLFYLHEVDAALNQPAAQR